MAETIQVQLQKATQANAELSAKLAELTASKTTAESDLLAQVESLNGNIAALNAELTAKAATITELTGKVTALEASEKDLATRAAAEAARIVAATGHKVIDLPAEVSTKNIFEQYKAEKDPDKRMSIMLANFTLFANNPDKIK